MEKTAQPTGTHRAAAVCLFALFAGAGLTVWMATSGSETHVGYLRAKATPVSAPGDARIASLMVNEGTSVVAGQPLITFSDEEFEQNLADKQRELETCQAELRQALARADVELAWRTQELESEIFDTQIRSAEFLKGRFLSEVEKLAWQDFLAGFQSVKRHDSKNVILQPLAFVDSAPNESHLKALLERESAENAAQVYGAQLELCEERLADLARLKDTFPELVRKTNGADVAEANVKRVESEIARLKEKQEDLSLFAAAYGTFANIRKASGDRVVAGETIAELVDRDRLYLDVFVPASRISVVQVSGNARIHFPGNEKREGIVREIIEPHATSPYGDGATSVPGMILVRVEPFGKLWPELPLGTSADVEFTSVAKSE